MSRISHTGCHIDGGVNGANIVLLVVTTTKVERSMGVVLKSSNGPSECHGGGEDSSLHLVVCLLSIKQWIGECR
jgi:hypothetical protein